MMAATEPSRESGSRFEVIGLSVLFGAMYFAQGVGDPSEGLPAQPVRSLLVSWGHAAGEIGLFTAILAAPWALKPLYGIFTDFIPLVGTRRRSYLILTSAVAMLGLFILSFMPLRAGAYGWLLALLVVPTIGVAFSDVVVDALMIERGQPLGRTGQFQSIQWACNYGAMILTGPLAGYLSAEGLQRAAFFLCALASGAMLFLSLAFVREAPRREARPSVSATFRGIGRALRLPSVLAAGAFLFLWNFNPFSTDVLYLHVTQRLRLGDQFFGNMMSLQALACLVASVAYGFYCRRVPMRWLVHGSIVLGIAGTLGYWMLADRLSAMAVSLLFGFTYMTATLIQLDLAARVCPPEAGGTAFATLMALTNLGLSASALVGGQFYQRWLATWSEDVAFNLLVAVGATCTAACWLLVPFVRRYSGAW